MSEETRRVLDLLAQGKVTVDEADQLLRAVTASAADATATAADDSGGGKRRWLRIAVHQQAKEGRKDKDVNIRVPISIVRSGMRLGALIPGLAGDQVAAKMRERGLDVDFTKLDAAGIDAILKELGDSNIEIDSGRATVRITCE
jgi:hypothetical protein